MVIVWWGMDCGEIVRWMVVMLVLGVWLDFIDLLLVIVDKYFIGGVGDKIMLLLVFVVVVCGGVVF